MPGRRDGLRRLVHLGIRQRSAVEQQLPVPDDPDDRRLRGAEWYSELLLHGAGEARNLREWQRTAADTRDGLLDRASDQRRESFCTRAYGRCFLLQHPQHRNLASGEHGIEVQRERALERGERQLVRA